MKITLEEIKKTAKLAKFNITEEEAQLYTGQLSAVLDWVEELRRIDTSSVETASGASHAPVREDIAFLSPEREAVISAFNDKEKDYLKVKKVL